MSLKSLSKRLSRHLSISSSSRAGPSSASTPHADAPVLPPAYEDVPVFAAPAEDIPFLPYEILDEIIYWAIIPAFDEYRQHDSPIHVQTLHSLANVSTACLAIVRRICRDAGEIPSDHRSLACNHASTERTFETAAAWMPVSVLAGIFHLAIFEPDRRHGSAGTVARITGYQCNLTALVLLIWDRQAMEGMEGVPRNRIYFTYQLLSAGFNSLRSVVDFNGVLKSLAKIRHLQFCYVKLGVPTLQCDVQCLVDAVTNIAPTRYLRVDIQVFGWAAGKKEVAGMEGYWAKLPVEVMNAGLSRGASRVDIGNFKADDAGVKSREIVHEGSLVNFIRAREIPAEAVREGTFAQMILGGHLDFCVAGGGGESKRGVKSAGAGPSKSLWKAVVGTNRVIVTPFTYHLTAVRDGQLPWMGDGEKFRFNHFFELATREGEHMGTAEAKTVEEGWTLH
ncbi:hypothetical protein H072_377 [Dactylellina haptotyla CBS 200.50]|uniref:Uncharacterized protein n=1 Tax=Dactylellina haptotyla (strain CBS 200.50) TaxID=1284197 RepID=S8C1J5_DACHA|nr:hypothetical protein H072_377 [Dactylellina haptotyla CBS 200.50]